MQTTHIVILLAYIALMILVGAWFARSKAVSTGDDFVLAGRSLPAPVLTGTLLATFVGSGSIIGGASFIYAYGPLAGVVFFGGEDSLNRLLGTVNSEDPTTGRFHFWRGTVGLTFRF